MIAVEGGGVEESGGEIEVTCGEEVATGGGGKVVAVDDEVEERDSAHGRGAAYMVAAAELRALATSAYQKGYAA